jgi:hypothetical protein
MIDSMRKTAILNAEREFERKENLARALAERGVFLVGKITSPPPADREPPLRSRPLS